MAAIKFIVALLVAVAGVSLVSGQGRITSPRPFFGTNNIMGYIAGRDACGLTSEQGYYYSQAESSPVLTVTAGQTVTLPYTIDGANGFGPLYVGIDANNNGRNFVVRAEVTRNIPSQSGVQLPFVGNYPYNVTLSFVVPSNLSCPRNGVCLFQVSNSQLYTSCFYVRVNPANTNNGGSTTTPTTPSTTSLYGGQIVTEKLQRLYWLTQIITNLKADPKILYQANYNVSSLITSLISVIN